MGLQYYKTQMVQNTWLWYKTQIYCVTKCKCMHHRKWWLSLTTQKRQGGSTTMCSLCYVLGHHRRIGLHQWSSKLELSSTVWSTLSHHLYWMASHWKVDNLGVTNSLLMRVLYLFFGGSKSLIVPTSTVFLRATPMLTGKWFSLVAS